ncbi:MAG TPA: electron transfer flavoprotein subunit alpha/FixB family protein, partial [Streptosporangiaceae bacterium]
MAEILVLAEHDGEAVKKVTFELVTLARKFGDPAVVWTGSGAEAAQSKLAEYGAAKVYVADGGEFDDYVVAPKAELLAELVQQKAPSAVLLASTAEGKEIGGRLAVKTSSGILTDVVGLSDGFIAEQLIFGGAINVSAKVRTGTPIIAVRPNAISLEPATGAASLEPVSVPISDKAKTA